jgi:hypothetical protein
MYFSFCPPFPIFTFLVHVLISFFGTAAPIVEPVPSEYDFGPRSAGDQMRLHGNYQSI